MELLLDFPRNSRRQPASRRGAVSFAFANDAGYRSAFADLDVGQESRKEARRVAHARILWVPGFTAATKHTPQKIAASGDMIRSLRDGRMNAKIGEYACLVRGSVDTDGWGPLMDSYALFQGLLRPLDTSEKESELYVYVTNPQTSWAWPEDGAPNGPYQVGKPRKSVFVTYVRSLEQLRGNRPAWMNDPVYSDVAGVASYWEWVRPVQGDPPLPVFSDSRYVRRIW